MQVVGQAPLLPLCQGGVLLVPLAFSLAVSLPPAVRPLPDGQHLRAVKQQPCLSGGAQRLAGLSKGLHASAACPVLGCMQLQVRVAAPTCSSCAMDPQPLLPAWPCRWACCQPPAHCRPSRLWRQRRLRCGGGCAAPPARARCGCSGGDPCRPPALAHPRRRRKRAPATGARRCERAARRCCRRRRPGLRPLPNPALSAAQQSRA